MSSPPSSPVRGDAGLSHDEAARRLAVDGPNRLPEPKSRPRWQLFLDQFRNLLIVILMGAAVLAGLVGDWKDTIVIAVAAGENDSFQTFAGPFRALVVMAASLFTLLSRSTVEADGVWSKDWLWATIGVSLYYGLIVAAQPIVAIVAPQSTSAARAVFTVKAIGDVVAFILIWRGMRCPLMQSNYSGST